MMAGTCRVLPSLNALSPAKLTDVWLAGLLIYIELANTALPAAVGIAICEVLMAFLPLVAEAWLEYTSK